MPTLIDDQLRRAEDNDHMSTSSKDSDSTHQSTGDPTTTPSIRLDGVLSSLRHAIASQRPKFAKVIVDNSRTMLRIDREIRSRSNTLAKFSSTYFDKDDIDENGQAKEKTFIPISLRTKLTLNSSALIQNDGRLASELDAITIARNEAIAAHEEFKVKAAASMKRMAEIEITARKKLLGFEYAKIMPTIAEGLTIVAINQPNRRRPTLSTKKIASLACLRYLLNRTTAEWSGCRFLETTEKSKVDEYIGYFCRENNVDPTSATGETRDDSNLIAHVIKQIHKVWPDMTIKLWAEDIKRDSLQKVDAELADLFESKAIVNANENLEKALDNGNDTTVLPMISKEVDRQLKLRSSRAKKSLRKKSSGDPKNHGSTPAKSGQSGKSTSKERSKKKKSKSRQESHQSSSKNSEDEDASSTGTGSSSGKKRGRSKSRPPPTSILKKPKVTFKKTEQSSSNKSRSRSKSKNRRDKGSPDNQGGSK